jgi:hypothetical protein
LIAEEYRYPQSNIDRLFKKLFQFLPYFTEQTISMGSSEDRKNMRNHFRGELPKEYQNVTLIADATDLPINKNENLSIWGEDGCWSYKLGCYGNLFVILFLPQVRFV